MERHGKLNTYLVQLVEKWKAGGSPKQVGFDWSARRKNWVNKFPADSEFIENLPDVIDRIYVRNLCESYDSNIRQIFLAIMIWGYGDLGYGPYRVDQMLNQKNSEAILNKTFHHCRNGDPILAYEFLSKNRIHVLGPSYSTKFMNFCTPRDVGAPIYDSYVAKWVNVFALDEFSEVRTASRNWNSKTYSHYWRWIKNHSQSTGCFPDEIEFVLFNDAEAQFSKSVK